jgi:urease accessory protein
MVDLPILHHMHLAIRKNNTQLLAQHIDLLLACRESHEMQEEERNRGKAMASLLDSLHLFPSPSWKEVTARSQLAGYAMALVGWGVPIYQGALGYLWSWLENQVMAGIKIIPLGQTQGQKLLLEIGEILPPLVERTLFLTVEEVGSTSPALAIASSQHETQYTRIYRS